MAFLLCDASAGAAYVELDLGSDQAEVWLSFRLFLDAAAFAFFDGASSNDFGDIFDAVYTPLATENLWSGTSPASWQLNTGDSAPPSPPLARDVWYDCELHYVNDGTVEFYVGGTLAVSGINGSPTDARIIQVGQTNGSVFDAAAVVRIDAVKVGTTRGASDLGADDFEGGDLSFWTATVGDVSLSTRPANDNFADALPLSGATGTDASVSDNSAATSEDDEPTGSNISLLRHTVWYAWTAPGDGSATFDTLGSLNLFATELDTTLAVWTGTTLLDLVEVASNDDRSALSVASACTFPVMAGTTYYVQFGSSAPGTLGSYVLNWNLATATALPAWRLEYWDHDYVPASEGSSTVVAGAGKRQTVAPENLHFVLRLGALGNHEAQWETSRWARQFETGDYALEAFLPEAEAHYFRLVRDSTAIVEGEVTETSVTVEEDEGVTHLKVAGTGFLGYLEQRLWLEDPASPDVAWPTGPRYDARGVEIGQVVTDILETVRDADDYSLRFTVDCDTTGTTIDYLIESGDRTPVGDKIRDLSMFADDSGGFDYQIEADDEMAKTFRLYHPRLGDSGAPVLTLTGQPQIATLEYRNRGPAATHVLGSGAGSVQSDGLGFFHVDGWIVGSGDGPAVNLAAKYHRRDAAAEFPEEAAPAQVAALTKAQSESLRKLVEELPLTVNAASIPDFWTTVTPGVYIEVDYDFGWQSITLSQRVVEMDCTITNELTETVVLSLNAPQLLPSRVLQPPQGSNPFDLSLHDTVRLAKGKR